MYRMQYHFEDPDQTTLAEMRDAATRSARIAQENGLRPANIWVSDDELTPRLVIEFTGKDKWECLEQEQSGKDVPELAAILGSTFRGRLTRLELYEEIDV